mmetsp:Transcript_10115/g.29943  ORF Transcript_10115/g.29943 Transcript_10115/m.29943 type:complete len:793 (-) Transcript_10115:299-2677(-)
MGEELSFREGTDAPELAQDGEHALEADEDCNEGLRLAQLIQLLSQQSDRSLLLSDLGALVPAGARQRLKDSGGLRSWLQQNTSLFVIAGPPGQESVSLAPGSDALTDAMARIAERERGEAARSTGNAAAAQRAASPAPFDEEVDGPSSLQLRGLPYRATAQDVCKFLGPKYEAMFADGCAGSAVHLLHNRDGRPSGFARVRLVSPEAAQACRDDLHLHSMEDRYVEVFVYSERPGKGRQRTRTGEEHNMGNSPEKESHKTASPPRDEGPRNICLAEAAGVTREQVVRECRQEMARQPRRRMLLSMLGVNLSAGGRAYLKQMDQGLKHFLRLFPSEFAVEGGKGCEYVVYTPQTLSEALDYDGQPQAFTEMAVAEAAAAAAANLAIPPMSPCPRKSPDVRISTGGARGIDTPSLWGTPAFKDPCQGHAVPDAAQFQGQAPWLPPWPGMPGMTQPDASGMPQGMPQWDPSAAGMAANAGAWAMPPVWAGWPQAQLPPWPATAPGADGVAQPPLPISLAFPGAFECGSGPAREAAAAGGVLTASTTTPESSNGSGHTTPPAGGAANATSSSVRLRGLPFSATEQDVFNFFGQYDVVDRVSEDPKAVNLLCRGNGRPSGQALVQMRSRNDAELARRILSGKWMGSRYIEVFLHGEDGNLEGMGGGAPPGEKKGVAGNSDEERRNQAAAVEAAAQVSAANAAMTALGPQTQGAQPWAMPAQQRAPVAQLWQMSCMAAMSGQAPPQVAMPSMPQHCGLAPGSQEESSWEALFHFLGREGVTAMAANMGGMPPPTVGGA